MSPDPTYFEQSQANPSWGIEVFLKDGDGNPLTGGINSPGPDIAFTIIAGGNPTMTVPAPVGEAEIFVDDSFQNGLLSVISDFLASYNWSNKVDWTGFFWSGGAPVSPVTVDSFTVYSYGNPSSTDITPS